MAKKKAQAQQGTPDWVIHEGDCRELLQAVPDQSIPLVFADPPFNIGYEYKSYDDKRERTDYLNWCATWLSELQRVLHPHGSFWLAIGDEYVSELDVMVKGLGLYKRSHVIWYYTFGVATSKNFARSHTHLLYYTKAKTKFTFNTDQRVPSARQLVYNDPRANPSGKLPDNTWVLSPVDLSKAFTPEEDTWLVSRVAGTFHERHERGVTYERRGCPQMPLKVMERIIATTSKPGDLVLDPFGGTFSTGHAALSLGRRFIGMEISAEDCQRGRERLASVRPNAGGGNGQPARPDHTGKSRRRKKAAG